MSTITDSMALCWRKNRLCTNQPDLSISRTC